MKAGTPHWSAQASDHGMGSECIGIGGSYWRWHAWYVDCRKVGDWTKGRCVCCNRLSLALAHPV